MQPRLNIPSIVLLALAVGGLLVGCGPLPDLGTRSETWSFPDTADTRLGQAIAPRLKLSSSTSGIAPLRNGLDAFTARTLLIDAADKSIDLQYYIWKQDLSGVLLFGSLQRAAERGVRVRLLLDDFRTVGMDARLAALNAHPNIEVRLFNPFRFRLWRVFEYVGDFSRVNRRMHNKSFIVDNQAAVLGGRNIGDEYFDAAQEGVMYDLDVLAIGAVVRQVSVDFDRYWASDSAYPADLLLPQVTAQTVAELREAGRQQAAGPAAAVYRQALQERAQAQSLLAGGLSFDWAPTRLLSDDPAKALGDRTARLLWDEIRPMLGAAEQELELISPYVVPHEQGAEFLLGAARAGTRVTVLTNSLEATDVAAVHAGYAKWRKRLLQGGVRLFELKRDLSGPAVSGAGPLGSSASSLHAKMFAMDRKRVFIGSFNFDPRSAHLNTENGLIIDSAALAGRASEVFAVEIPQQSYEVRLDEQGSLQWIERRDGQTLVHDDEPGVSTWRALSVAILSRLPIDWLL